MNEEHKHQKNVYQGGIFKDIYYYLYSNSNIPRAERLSAEFVRILFCKLVDDLKHIGTISKLIALSDNEAERVLSDYFEYVKKEYPDVFTKDEHIYLDINSAKYVFSKLANIDIVNSERDILAESFQTFLGPVVRGEKGQFFTPKSAARAVVDILDPSIGEHILDPACGSGTFLTSSYLHLLKKYRNHEKKGYISDAIYGIDKEFDLVKVCKTYMALIGNGRSGIHCFDSLDRSTWPEKMIELARGGFDVIMTNPPFGTKIGIKNERVLQDYSLAYKWKYSSSEKRWIVTKKLLQKQDPQVLFIELCVKLLKPGGRLGIVLPEGILGNKNSNYILDYLRSQGDIFAIIDAPRNLFQPSTDIKTAILFFKKYNTEYKRGDAIFMSEVHYCGHDSRGRTLFDSEGKLFDEFPKIASLYKHGGKPSRLGFFVKQNEYNPYYLIPRYYNPEIKNKLDFLKDQQKMDIISLGELESRKIIKIFRGVEPKSNSHNSGSIPFVRTSDIANLEINFNTTMSVDEETFRRLSKRVIYKPLDILVVNDGRYRIGNNCMLTENSTKIVLQNHIRIIRVEKSEKLDPFLLLYLFNTKIVRGQINHKIFIQSTIATLGNRLKEILIPIPKNDDLRKKISDEMRTIVMERAKQLKRANEIINTEFEKI